MRRHMVRFPPDLQQLLMVTPVVARMAERRFASTAVPDQRMASFSRRYVCDPTGNGGTPDVRRRGANILAAAG
jgi:hypothetical protein